jgi:hypothetical protein
MLQTFFERCATNHTVFGVEERRQNNRYHNRVVTSSKDESSKVRSSFFKRTIIILKVPSRNQKKLLGFSGTHVLHVVIPHHRSDNALSSSAQRAGIRRTGTRF